ncbi:MAG TPA: OmpA family protein [Thermoanaerobaculia bacterium]|nr:OmpA family protein [Thermoanaerobaculia bacterium]
MTTQASRLLSAAFVARATTMARDGRLDAAESLLREALQADRSLEALDVLARIRAQQGRLAEAEALWSEVLGRESTLEAAQAGLRRIHAIQTRRAALWPFAVAVVLLIAVFAIGLRRAPTPAAGHLAPAAVLAPPTSAPATASSRPPAGASSAGFPSIPGVVIREQAGELVATFEAGLFSHGVSLSSEGRALLEQLGQQIERHAPAAHVIIEGHCDRVPLRSRGTYKDDFALGLARSGTVFHYLKQTAGLPAEAFSLRSFGSDAPPFAETGYGAETRNRTVVIRIRP